VKLHAHRAGGVRYQAMMNKNQIQEMFQAIAPRYDLLNRMLSLRQDVHWRRALVKGLKIPKGGKVLDVGTGSADIPLEIARQRGSDVSIFGVDFAWNMLCLGKDKIARVRRPSHIFLIKGEAFSLPFKPASFDAVTVAFAIRNLPDRKQALITLLDQLKPGGQIMILELSTPRPAPLKYIYLWYFERLLPLIGRVISRNQKAYSYLPDSVLRFPPPSTFSGLMKNAGFERITYQPLIFGIAILFSGFRPRGAAGTQ